MERKEDQFRYTYINKPKLYALWDSISEKEKSFTRYIYAQSSKFRAIYSEPLSFHPRVNELNSFYLDLNLLMEFITIEGTIRIKEIYTYQHLIKKFNNNQERDLQENCTEMAKNRLIAQKHFIDTLMVSNEHIIKQIKFENKKIKRYQPPSENEFLTFINNMYELHEISVKKMELLFTLGFIHSMNVEYILPFYEGVDTSVKITKDFLSAFDFESSFIRNSMQRRIISLIKLKNRVYAMTDSAVIHNTEVRIAKEAVNAPWLSKKIKAFNRNKK